MKITFTINRSKEKLEKQFSNLVRKGTTNRLLVLKKIILLLIISTIGYLLIYLLFPNDSLITVKAIGLFTIIFCWSVTSFLPLIFWLRNIRNKKSLKNFVHLTTEEDLKYDVEINFESVKIINTNNILEIPWSDYETFTIINDTIYIYNIIEVINTLYWDRDEMGDENFTALLNLLKQKSIAEI